MDWLGSAGGSPAPVISAGAVVALGLHWAGKPSWLSRLTAPSWSSAGPLWWNVYTWPLHVAWASHSMCLGSEREFPKSEDSEREEAEAQNFCWPRISTQSFSHSSIGKPVTEPRFKGREIECTKEFVAVFNFLWELNHFFHKKNILNYIYLIGAILTFLFCWTSDVGGWVSDVIVHDIIITVHTRPLAFYFLILLLLPFPFPSSSHCWQTLAGI